MKLRDIINKEWLNDRDSKPQVHVCIHIPTYNDYLKLKDICERQGLFPSSDLYPAYWWNSYKEEFCIYPGNMYGDTGYALRHNYTIYEVTDFDDFYKTQPFWKN